MERAVPKKVNYDAFFTTFESRALEAGHDAWGWPLYEQRANVRKFLNPGTFGMPRHVRAPFVGYQLNVSEGPVLRSEFVVYVPDERWRANTLQAVFERERARIESLHEGGLFVENVESNAGSCIYDAIPAGIDDEAHRESLAEWLVDSQRRLRHSLAKSHVEATFIEHGMHA